VYAIKQAEKTKLQRMRKEADLFMEKHCLSKLKGIISTILDCDYVVRLWKTFQDQIHLFLQMDCPQNG
jgi:3-phosphoinositide dependent protein kinase-1